MITACLKKIREKKNPNQVKEVERAIQAEENIKNPGYGPLHSTSFRILLPYLHESILGGLEERKKSWRDVYCLSHLRDFFLISLPPPRI